MAGSAFLLSTRNGLWFICVQCLLLLVLTDSLALQVFV